MFPSFFISRKFNFVTNSNSHHPWRVKEEKNVRISRQNHLWRYFWVRKLAHLAPLLHQWWRSFVKKSWKTKKTQGTAPVRQMLLSLHQNLAAFAHSRESVANFTLGGFFACSSWIVRYFEMQARQELMCCLPSDFNWVNMCCLGWCVLKTVENCWNHAKILPAAVVATGPENAILNELAALLL